MITYNLRALRMRIAALQVFITLPPQQNGRHGKADQAHCSQHAHRGEERQETVVIQNVVEQVRYLLCRIQCAQYGRVLRYLIAQSHGERTYKPENSERMQARAVHNPCLALVERPGNAPINVPNALVANDAIKHAHKPAHSRPPREI